MERYPIPAEETQIEIVVVNSRFIVTIAPVFTVQEAKAFIARIKKQYADASHNVPAFVVGHGSSVVAHCSDDGEPAGTAGRPALAVLQGSGLGDVAVVVTRYFGGTKLGTGGLVRAYGNAVREVLRAVRRAVKVPTDVLHMSVPYSLFEQVCLLVKRHRGQVEEQAFAAEVSLTARFPSERVAGFCGALRELSNGQITASTVRENEVSIVRLSTMGGL